MHHSKSMQQHMPPLWVKQKSPHNILQQNRLLITYSNVHTTNYISKTFHHQIKTLLGIPIDFPQSQEKINTTYHTTCKIQSSYEIHSWSNNSSNSVPWFWFPIIFYISKISETPLQNTLDVTFFSWPIDFLVIFCSIRKKFRCH